MSTSSRLLHAAAFLTAALLLLLGGAARAATPTILVVGDSLSAGYGIALESGWVSLLEARLDRAGFPHRVVNASISGDTTHGALNRLPAALDRHRPELVILELGGNDGLRALSVAQMEENLAAMIEQSRDAGARVLLVGIRIPPNYGPLYTGKFQAVYPRLAERYDVPLVPFLLDGVATEPGLMQPDGIHPRAEAQPRLLDNVWAALEPLLRDGALAARASAPPRQPDAQGQARGREG